MTGTELEGMAAQMLNLARVSGSDVSSIIASTTRVFGDWGVATSDQTTALDYLFKASQATGIEVGRLSETLVQYGAPLRQMGFDFEESAALLSKFEKEGVNAELVLGSLRIALTQMAQEGVTDTNAALQEVIEQIKNAGSAGEANALALETFGSRAGPDMAAAIREGRFEIDELITSLKNSGETINTAAEDTLSFSERMTLFKNKLMDAIEPLGTTLLDSFEKMRPTIEKIIGLIEKIATTFSNLPEPVKTGILAITGAFAIGGPVLSAVGRGISAFGQLAPAFGDAAGKIASMALKTGPWGLAIAGAIAGVALLVTHWDEIKEFFSNLWASVSEAASIAWDGIKSSLSFIWEGAISVGKDLWNGFKDFFGDLWDGIKSGAVKAWEGIKGALKSAWEGIKSVAESVWGGISGFFGDIWNTITGKGKTAEIEVIQKEIGFDNYENAADSLEYHTIPELELGGFDTQSLNSFADELKPLANAVNITINHPVVREEQDIEKIGNDLVHRLYRAGIA